jgi:serine/threonine-protein kinase
VTPLDGTLRAIVAADRLGELADADGEGEARALLGHRLTLFYGSFALLAGLAAALGRIRLDSRSYGLVRDAQTAHAVVVAVVFLGLRRVRDPRALHALDVFATLATAAMGAFGLASVRSTVTVDVSAVAFFVLFFVVRAALVPGKPWIGTSIAAVSGIPFALGLAALYRHGAVPDPDAATFAAARSLAAGVAGVWLVSRTIYGLRSAVERAVRLGQYEVHEKIGEGGMGAIYRASHAMLKRPTAIKVIPPDRASGTATARFEREALAASRLTHPNVVAIYDFGRTRGGVFYYAMELLDGEDLGKLVAREGRQPMARTRHIVRQIAGALAEAHDAGLVHRDVKLENVMLCTRGGMDDFVKVLDFGLVKELAVPDAKLTGDGSLAGTPLYMSPESIMSPETVGPPADVYALGCVAYSLLTGCAPFEGYNLVEVCAAHVHDTPKPPSSLAPDVPTELDALILRCLAKEPLDRPTAQELEAALA